MAILIGIDPSFSACGLAILNTKTKQLFLDVYRHKHPWRKDFVNTALVIEEVVSYVQEKVFSLGDRVYIISEVPPPDGQMSSALYGLDVMLLYRLSLLSNVCRIDILQPTFLNHVHGTRKTKPTDHKNLGVNLLNIYSSYYTVNYRSGTTICQDEGVAVVFLSRLYAMLNNNKLSEALTAHSRNLLSPKEINYYTRR